MKDVAARIAKRTRLADLHMQQQGWLGRIFNRISLYVANGVDQATSFANDTNVVFLGATAAGLLRGAAYATVVTLLAIAIIQPLGPAMGIGGFLAIAAASAIGYGIYDGQKALEANLSDTKPHVADIIARDTGALPFPGHEAGEAIIRNNESHKYRQNIPPVINCAQQILADEVRRKNFCEKEQVREEAIPTEPQR